MRIAVTLLLLSSAVAAVPAAQPPAPGMPPMPAPATGTPTDAALDALIADTLSRDNKIAVEAARKLVDLGPAAVPALTQGLWSDSNTRRSCITVLGTIGDDARSAAPSLIRLLNDDAPDIRQAVASALASLGAPSAIPALAKLLEDKSATTRFSAAQALIRLGADADMVIPVLTKSLKSEKAEEGYIAAQLLGELGPEAAPALLALNDELGGADPILTALLADTLGRIGPTAKDAVQTLKKKVNDDKNPASYRVQVALAVWRIARDEDAVTFLRDSLTEQRGRLLPHAPLWRIDQSKETIDALAKELKAENPSRVFAAGGVLGARSKDTAPALLKNLGEVRDAATLVSALTALGDIGPEAKDALKTLQTVATGKAPGVSVPAAVAIYRITPTAQAATAITDFLEEKEFRLEAAEALKALRPTGQAVVVELLHALDNPDEHVKLAAAVALWRIEKHAQALPSITKRLRSPDAKVRALAAVDVGGEFGADAKPAVPELVKRLFDPFASVRSASAEALGRIGPGAQAATGPMLALLEGDEPAFVQSAACEALGLIQPTEKDEAVAVLKRKLEHPDALVRAHAALALFLVSGDKTGEQEALEGLGHRTHYVRITAAETVWRMNKDAKAVPLLVRALEESNLEGTMLENERYMAARALGRVGAAAKPAVPELVKLIDHREYTLAMAARAALKAIDPDAAKKAGVK